MYRKSLLQLSLCDQPQSIYKLSEQMMGTSNIGSIHISARGQTQSNHYASWSPKDLLRQRQRWEVGW